jgi:hypothetical protein
MVGSGSSGEPFRSGVVAPTVEGRLSSCIGVASPSSRVGLVCGVVALFLAVVLLSLDNNVFVFLLLSSFCCRFVDIVSEVAVSLGRSRLSLVAEGGVGVIALETESGLSGGLGLDPLMADRSSLVKMELRMETLPPSKHVLPDCRTWSWACWRILVLVQQS